jgi:MFS transporter, ACS family, hexuronate transporter
MELKNTKISKNAWVVIILLFLLTVISNADKAIIGFASVPIMEELGLTPEQWGIVGSVFFLLYSLCAILGGALADRFGTKMVIIGMVIIWSFVQFSTIFVTGFAFLLITRIILGAGEGPSYSLAMTAATKWLPREKLGIGISFISIGGPLGVAVSAPILMKMIMNYGWRSAFIATGVIGFVWIVAWMLAVKNDKASNVNSSNVKESPDVTENQPQSKFMSVVLSKNFIFIALSGFATYWAFTVGLNWLPNYLEKVRQLNPETLQLVVSLPWILITISQITFSSISDRLFLKTNNIVKSRVFVLGLVMMTGAACYFLGTVIGLEALAIALLFLGLTFGCITLVLGPTILSQLVAKQHQGKIQGWFMAITSLGGIAGPYVTGILVQNGATPLAGFHTGFQVCALVMVVCGGLVLAGVRPKKSAKTEIIGSGTVQNM